MRFPNLAATFFFYKSTPIDEAYWLTRQGKILCAFWGYVVWQMLCLSWCSAAYYTILYWTHYSYAIMSAMVSQITGVSIVCLTACSGADQRKHQSSASLAFVREIHRWPIDFPNKGPVTRKTFPFDGVIMYTKESITFGCQHRTQIAQILIIKDRDQPISHDNLSEENKSIWFQINTCLKTNCAYCNVLIPCPLATRMAQAEYRTCQLAESRAGAPFTDMDQLYSQHARWSVG